MSTTSEGTILQLPLEKNEPQLIVFTPGKVEIDQLSTGTKDRHDTLLVDENWEFELKPTLNNKYGDYRLPAFDEKLGAETSEMKYKEETIFSKDWQNPTFDDSKWTTETVSYGPQFWKLGPLSSTVDLTHLESKLSALEQIDHEKPIEIDGKKYYWSAYEFSWRWALKGDAGHQGHHGLKGLVNDELISLGDINRTKGDSCIYYLWSTVQSSGQINAKISKSGLTPEKIYLNHLPVDSSSIHVELKAGKNPVLLKYNTLGRGYYIFEKINDRSEKGQEIPLSTEWFTNPNILTFDCIPDSIPKIGWYRFISPPGVRAMFIQTTSKPRIWINGYEIPCSLMKKDTKRFIDPKFPAWEVVFPDSVKHSLSVSMRIEMEPGFYGGAAIPEPISYTCSKGQIQIGDLFNDEALKTYSGGMWYRKTINFSAEQVNSKHVILDLGKVVASAEVFINGKSVGSKVSSPWTFDLTGKLKPGRNRIEILVYNTLGNHYLTVPTAYVGRTSSGLIGPVKIIYANNQPEN